MHADVAIQAAGFQPLYQGDDVDARLHTKRTSADVCMRMWESDGVCVCCSACVSLCI